MKVGEIQGDYEGIWIMWDVSQNAGLMSKGMLVIPPRKILEFWKMMTVYDLKAGAGVYVWISITWSRHMYVFVSRWANMAIENKHLKIMCFSTYILVAVKVFTVHLEILWMQKKNSYEIIHWKGFKYDHTNL